MYSVLLNLWISGKMTEEGLLKAVSLGWISDEQKNEIMMTDR